MSKKALVAIEPGLKIGYLMVLKRVGPRGSDIDWEVFCMCGNFLTMRAGNLREYTKRDKASCGCMNQYRHGYGRDKRYKVYLAMLDRCYNPKIENFHRYGGRGISVCEAWRNDIHAFMADTEEGYAPGLQIDRENNNGNYEPGNVRWVTALVNNRNRECVKNAKK